ncbi:Cell division cycle-associated protein 2, partial [Lonchura striata]
MFRGSKTPLKVKENESGCPEQKEEASLPPSRAQKSCKATKPRVIRPSKKENFTDGKGTRSPKRAWKCPRGPEESSCQPQGADVGWQLPGGCSGALGGDVLSEPPLPLLTREDLSSSPAAPLGNAFSTPERDQVEGKPDFGLSEQRKKPVDFAAVLNAEVGIAQEGFGTRPTGPSPTSLKFRRRSTIGLRGSPENNTLIRYLAQQRSSRQKEAFTQISPFKPANVRSLKDKIDAFQASFESLQEAEAEAGPSHLGEPAQEGRSSQNKPPSKKEPNLEQWTEKFMLGNSGAALKENLRANGSKSSRSELRICSILSPHQAVTVTDPAAEKVWVCEQQNPVKSLDTVVTGDSLETGHETTDSQNSKTPKKKKVTFGEVLSPEIFDQSLPANTPLRRGASPGRPLGQSPGPGPGLSQEPLPPLDFAWDDKTKYPSYGKRRKRKVKKSLYGEREMASKKPLLSPIPEIPEVFSSVSSPDSPKADALFTDAKGDFDTSDYFQQGKEILCGKEAKESSSLIEKEELQGNLLSGLEILEQQDVQEDAQRAKCPQKDSVR